MKRKIVWLALPLVLGALMFGVIWCRDHPTASKRDLAIRTLLVKSSHIDVILFPTFEMAAFDARLSAEEKESLISNLFTLPQPMNVNATVFSSNRTRGRVQIFFSIVSLNYADTTNVSADMDIDGNIGELFIDRLDKDEKYQIHPAAVKRWIALLLANNKVGPELRARMNQ